MNRLALTAVTVAALAGATQVMGQGAAAPGKGGTDQILDKKPKPAYEMSVAFSPASDYGSYGDSALTEINADWAAAYFWDVLEGDIDLNGRLRALLFMGSAGDINLPSQLMQISLNGGWTWRYVNQTAFQLRAYPGIYSDLEDVDLDVFYMPVSVAFISSFTPELSGMIGAEIRPRFDRLLMPIIGLAWQADPSTRIEAGLPESRFIYTINRDVSTHVGLDWRSTSFSVKDEDDTGRDQMTVEDIHAYCGGEAKFTDQISFRGDVGLIVARHTKFDDGAAELDDSVNVDNAPFIRVAMKGMF